VSEAEKPESLIACDGCGVMQRVDNLIYDAAVVDDPSKNDYYCDECYSINYAMRAISRVIIKEQS
jgi:hypothetical protein